MSGIAPYVLVLWALQVIAQLVVCGFLFYRGHFRKLPLFTTYVTLDVIQAAFLFFLYNHFGFQSPAARVFAWLSMIVVLLAEIFATVELLHHVLSPYRGVWILARRLFWIASIGIILFTGFEARVDLSRANLYADRGFHLAFALSLLTFLLLGRHYFIPFHPVYRALLAGLCFRSCILVFNDTLSLSGFFHQSVHSVNTWNATRLLSAIAIQIVWTYFLRKSISAYVYTERFTERPRTSSPRYKDFRIQL